MPVFGFNVISHVSGNLGIGVTARNIIKLLIEKGYPVAIFDIDPGQGRGGYDLSFNKYAVKVPEKLPYSINLFVLPPETLIRLFPVIQNSISKPGRLNVAFSMWELTVLSPASILVLQEMDVLVAESNFIRHVFEFNLSDVFIISATHPLYFPKGIKSSREHFGLPEEEIIFLTSFEPSSDVQRKNPFAILDAFEHSSYLESRAHLVVKLNNAKIGGQVLPTVKSLIERCEANPRIHIFVETVTYPEVLSLISSCDVFVSLHRAEGLGLSLMESMALGKPVIATAWSGNMTFMDHTNSCLVSYKLVSVTKSVSVYSQERLGHNAIWAEPNVDEAATWMCRLVYDRVLRSTIGAKAAKDMKRFHKHAKRGHFIEELRTIWKYRTLLIEPI